MTVVVAVPAMPVVVVMSHSDDHLGIGRWDQGGEEQHCHKGEDKFLHKHSDAGFTEWVAEEISNLSGLACCRKAHSLLFPKPCGATIDVADGLPGSSPQVPPSAVF